MSMRGDTNALAAHSTEMGLDLRAGWWPTPAELDAIAAAGFRAVQITAPPVRMLASPRHSVGHAKALSTALAPSGLRPILHAPTSLRLGDALNDRAFEGLLEYASQVEARQVVYHALDMPRRGRDSAAEELALERLGGWAEALGITICLENLCPVYPGASSVCYDPLAVRDLALRIGSPAVALALDIGHAAVVADSMGTHVAALVEPVVARAGLIHLHDNFGARAEHYSSEELDPLLLDLHLVPGKGRVDFERVAPLLAAHQGPVIIEVESALRESPAALYDAGLNALRGSDRPQLLAA